VKSILSKHPHFALGIAALVLLAVAVPVGISASGGDVPAPGATPFPGSGVSSSPGQRAEPEYLEPLTLSAGTALHMSFTTYDYAPGVRAATNGHEIEAEVWILVDSEGSPDLLLGRYSSGGSVVQTIYQTRTGSEVKLGSPVPAGKPDGSTMCLLQMPGTAAELYSALPRVVRKGFLPAAGFARSEAFTRSAHPNPDDEAWSRTVAIARPAGVRTNLLSYDADSGLATGWHSTTTSEKGELLAEHWESYEHLEIVPRSAAPTAEHFLGGGPCQG